MRTLNGMESRNQHMHEPHSWGPLAKPMNQLPWSPYHERGFLREHSHSLSSVSSLVLSSLLSRKCTPPPSKDSKLESALDLVLHHKTVN